MDKPSILDELWTKAIVHAKMEEETTQQYKWGTP